MNAKSVLLCLGVLLFSGSISAQDDRTGPPYYQDQLEMMAEDVLKVEDLVRVVYLENAYDLAQIDFDKQDFEDKGELHIDQGEFISLRLRLGFQRKSDIHEDELLGEWDEKKNLPVVVENHFVLGVRDGRFCLISKRDFMVQQCQPAPTLDEAYTIDDQVEVLSWSGFEFDGNPSGHVCEVGEQEDDRLYGAARVGMVGSFPEDTDPLLPQAFDVTLRVFLKVIDTDDRGIFDWRNAPPKVEAWAENDVSLYDSVEVKIGENRYQSPLSAEEQEAYFEELGFQDFLAKIHKGIIELEQDDRVVYMTVYQEYGFIRVPQTVEFEAEVFQEEFTPEEIRKILPGYRWVRPKNEI